MKATKQVALLLVPQVRDAYFCFPFIHTTVRKRAKRLDADSINVDDEECDYEGDVTKLRESLY